MFGAKFSSQFRDHGDNVTWLETWGMGLADKSAEELKRGVQRMLTECEWPPSLPEFRKLCEKPVVDAAHRRWVALPTPKDATDRSAQIDALLAKVVAAHKPKDHNYAWTLRLNKQTAVDYIWRDKDCKELHAFMVKNGVCDEEGKMTQQQIARAA